jgi:hypothetical protein
VRDSAGIQIVENTAPQWKDGESWSLSADPSVDIGVVDGPREYQLNWVTDALLLPSGQIAVADGGSQEIRFYNASGTYLHSVGRKGGGPGEFQGLFWMQALTADSLVAYDRAQRRMSTFDPQGRLIESTTFTLGAVRGTPLGIGRFNDGSLLVRLVESPASGMVDGVHRDSLLFVRYSADDSLLNVLAGFRGAERFNRLEGTGVSYGAPFFARSTQYAVRGNRLFAGDNDVYQIGAYRADGKLERFIRRIGELRQVTENDVEVIRQRRLDVVAGVLPQVQKRYSAMVAEEPIPSTMPAFASLLFDTVGDLWVQEYPMPSEDGTDWTVFDPHGRMLGNVPMPDRFEPMQVGDNYVLGVWKDDLDVQHVRMYRLEKPK